MITAHFWHNMSRQQFGERCNTAVKGLLKWVHYFFSFLSAFNLDILIASIRMPSAERQFSGSTSLLGRMTKPVAELTIFQYSYQWRGDSYPDMECLIWLLETSCLLTWWLFIHRDGRQWICATEQQSADYLWVKAYLFEAKNALPLFLSEPDANEPTHWLTASHKLITSHTW